MQRQLTAVIIGAGSRGRTYADEMLQMDARFRVVAVAEPAASRRSYISSRHGLCESACFDDWRKLLAKGKLADVAVISTMDRAHFAPALKAVELGYDILLEKPVSPDPRECEILACAAEKAGVKVIVCHVLRYTPFFTTIKDLIHKGVLGENCNRLLQKLIRPRDNGGIGGRKQLHPRPERWSSHMYRQMELDICETFWGPCEEEEIWVQ